MHDEVRADLNRRLMCVRGHLEATARMIERGEDDLAVAHQVQAVRGALTQIQVRLLREWLQRPGNVQELERDLSEILQMGRRRGLKPHD